MKVKTLKPFKDLNEAVVRKAGEEFEVDKERFDELANNLPGFVEEIAQNEEIEQPEAAANQKSKGKKSKKVVKDGTE